MKREIIITILFSSVLLSGCKSTNNDETSLGYRCEEVTATGTHIKNVYCSTEKERREARLRGQEALRNSQRAILTGSG